MPSNPYRAGNPVGGSPAFVGRTDVLRAVQRVLGNPHENAIVLYGQRRIGKTSVLLELVQRLAASDAYRPVYFDLQDKAARPLAQRITEKLQLPPPEGWNGDAPGRFREEFLLQVTRQIMLWWLVDELVRAMRSESAFSQWLHSEQLEGRWTKGQRAQVAEAAKGLGRGVRDLMRAFAVGAGAGAANA